MENEKYYQFQMEKDNRSKKNSTEKMPRLKFLLLGALTLFWGLNWPIMKIALGEIRPWTFRSLCLILGGLGVIAIAKAKRLQLAIPKMELRPLLIVAFLNVTCWQLFSAYGLMYMKAGRAAIVAFSMPVWASLLAVIILGEHLTFSRLMGLGLGMVGLAILIGPGFKVLGSVPLGVIFMLGAAISWAAGTVFIKYFCWTIPTLTLTGWQLLLGGIPVILGTFVLEPVSAVSLVSWRGVLATAYVIILPVILCYWAWFEVVQLFPASIVAIGTLAIPIVGVLSSTLVLGESIGFQEITALILMTVALAIVMIRPRGF
jgi:drug/metabolite transporter (DMT)-like permease